MHIHAYTPHITEMKINFNEYIQFMLREEKRILQYTTIEFSKYAW